MDESHIEKINIDKSDDAENIKYCIEGNVIHNDAIEIWGWILEKGKDIKTVDLSIALKENNSSTAYIIPTQNAARPDVTKEINDGFNYEYSGFNSLVPVFRLNKNITKYDIFFIYKNNGKAYIISANEAVILTDMPEEDAK